MHLQYRSQDGLWKHMAKTCPVQLMSSDEYKQRRTLCASLIDEVNRPTLPATSMGSFLHRRTNRWRGSSQFSPIRTRPSISVAHSTSTRRSPLPQSNKPTAPGG